MPRGDSTGSKGQGPGTGRGLGRFGGRGRMGGTCPDSGPGGNCMYPACGNVVVHQRGTPCYDVVCPQCGASMIKQ